MGANLLSIQK